METTSALNAARRRWWIIVLLAAVGAALAAVPQPEQVAQESALTTYSATHTLLLNNTDVLSSNDLAVSPNQIPLLTTTGIVPERVKEEIGFSGNPAELASQVKVFFDSQTGALSISTTQSSATSAEQIANAFSDQLTGYLVERQDAVYETRVSAYLDRLDTLQVELDDITDQLGSNPDDPVLQAKRDALSRRYSVAFEQSQQLAETPPILAFTTLQRAQAIAEVSAGGGLSAPRSRLTRGLMGLVAGAGVGVAVAFLLGQVDRRLRTREQAEAVLGLRARATIPKVSHLTAPTLVVRANSHDSLSDSYRTLRNVVGFVHSGLEPTDEARITVVVSPGPGEGKTSLAANLAAAFVETGQRVIVVNTDFRRPRLAPTVSPGQRVSLPCTLEDLDSLDPELLLTETVDPNLMLLDLRSLGSVSELARATARLLPRLKDLADAIVVDTAPIGAAAEALEVIPMADVIIVVAKLGQTHINAAERTVEVLRDLTTAPLVLALTGVTSERTVYYDYTDRRRSSSGRSWRNGFKRYAGPERRQSDRGPGPRGQGTRRSSDLPIGEPLVRRGELSSEPRAAALSETN